MYRVTSDGTLLFLLLQAQTGKPWGFPKGKIDAGESEEEAARREVTEEAGLSALSFESGFRQVVRYTFRRGRLLVKKDVVYFLACAQTDEVHISWEHVAFRWAALREALDLVAYDNARELLQSANAFLETRYHLENETAAG